MEGRICVQCSRHFVPSSGHLRCPSCRLKGVCACGGPKRVKSAVCRRCRSVAGDCNGNWKGGRTYHERGYTMLRIPVHPRAGRGMYVFEHILVMEAVLGRYILPDETVHHLNGVRDDNRPENLELWTRPQPSGVRAGDVLAWAHEIIRRYEPPDALEVNEALGGGGDRTRVRNQVPCDLYERSPGIDLIPAAPWDRARRRPVTVHVPTGAVTPPAGETAHISVGSHSRSRGGCRRQAVA